MHPNRQGKGIGAKLLQFLFNYYVIQNSQTVGLLVDEDNPNAKRLYLKLGFESGGEKMLVVNRMYHLQVNPDFLIQ